MARFVRIGNVVLDPTRVKVARIQTGESPELRMLLRTPNEGVQVQAQSMEEASAWLDDLGTHTGLQRVQQALLPVTQVRMAQALPARKVKGKREGPGLRLSLSQERVTLPTDTLEAAEAFLDELLEVLPGGAWGSTSEPPPGGAWGSTSEPPPVPPPPVVPAALAAPEVASGPALDSLDPDFYDAAPDEAETPWDEDEDEAAAADEIPA